MDVKLASWFWPAAGACLLLAACSPRSAPELANAAPMVIVPRESVGSIKASMTMSEVVAQWGEPQRRTANALEYTRLGLAVMPGPDGLVKVVMCGDVTGLNGPFVKAFTGRTREGIGMNSTREELIKALGEPTRAEKLPGDLESITYTPLGLTFTLQAGKVHHMIVRLGASEPDRTVTLEGAKP